MSIKLSKMHPWKTGIKGVKEGESYDSSKIKVKVNEKKEEEFYRPRNYAGEKGVTSEYMVAGALSNLGYNIFFPQTHFTKADLIFEDKTGKMFKVQVKTARSVHKDGKISFSSCTPNSKNNTAQSYKQYGIDFFGVYYPYRRKVFLVPISEITSIGTEILRDYDQEEYQIWPPKDVK